MTRHERDEEREEPNPRESHDLIQTEMCADWSEPPAAVANSLRTVSGSAASRRPAPNVATVTSAS